MRWWWVTPEWKEVFWGMTPEDRLSVGIFAREAGDKGAAAWPCTHMAAETSFWLNSTSSKHTSPVERGELGSNVWASAFFT